MPTYEYVCTACENHWEEVQKISEPPLETCPKCAKSTAKRQISGGNFILKGGGWYADLYASSSNKKTNGEAKVDANGASGSKDAASSSNGAANGNGSASKSEGGTSTASSSATPTPSTTPAAKT